MGARVPGPFRRLVRNRRRLLALILVAATPLAASTMQSTTTLVLQNTLNDNWRGSYDLLVTARNEDPVTAGMLRPDTLVDAATGRLSGADLDLIRSLPGVDVAAPVTQVSFSASNVLSDPQVWVPIPVQPDSGLTRPQAFRVTITGSIDDVTGPRTLPEVQLLTFTYAPQLGEVVLGTNGLVLRTSNGQIAYADASLADRPRLLSADTRVDFTAGNYDSSAGAVPVGLYLTPRPAGLVTLVDPVAERELLGEAGAFLDPLVEAAANDSEAMPILTLDRPETSVRLVITVEEFESVLAADSTDPNSSPLGFLQYGSLVPRLPDDVTTRIVGTYSVEAGSTLVPFRNDRMILGDLNTGGINAFVTTYHELAGPGPRSVAQARYSVPDDIVATGTGVQLLPRGYVAGSQYVEAPLSRGAPVGSVTEFSKVFSSLTSGLSDSERDLEGRIRVVGSYSSADLTGLTSSAGYTPLGGYDVASPSLVKNAAGDAVAPEALPTSLTGYGIPGTNTMAIGDIRMLDRWSVDRPITAIRVRLSGIDEFTPLAQRKLLDAVLGLRALGFTATIMAGSSPQTLPVTVTGYAGAELDDRGMQVIGDLGTIEQRWSRFGAVAEAQVGVTVTSIALVALATASVGGILAAVQLGSIPTRRATVEVLRQQGWRRRRAARWFAGEELIAVAALVLVGAVAVAVSETPVVAAASSIAAVVLVAVTSTIAVVASLRPRRASSFTPATPSVAGAISFGLRQARTNLAATVSLALAIVVLCVIVAVGVTVFVEGRRAAGPSDLGALATLRALLPQSALVVVGLVSAGLLARLARGMRIERSRDQRAALRAMGWSRTTRTVAAIAESAVAVVPAATLATVASVLIAAQSSPDSLVGVAAASILAAVGAFAVVVAVDRRLD